MSSSPFFSHTKCPGPFKNPSMSNTCRTTTRSSKIRWVSNACRNSVYSFFCSSQIWRHWRTKCWVRSSKPSVILFVMWIRSSTIVGNSMRSIPHSLNVRTSWIISFDNCSRILWWKISERFWLSLSLCTPMPCNRVLSVLLIIDGLSGNDLWSFISVQRYDVVYIYVPTCCSSHFKRNFCLCLCLSYTYI